MIDYNIKIKIKNFDVLAKTRYINSWKNIVGNFEITVGCKSRTEKMSLFFVPIRHKHYIM
jgi:hypothetical protein